MKYGTRAAFDAIFWKCGDLLNFDDLVLAAAQEVALRKKDARYLQLADDIMNLREAEDEQ